MGCCVCVKESDVGYIESFGRFNRIAYAGVTCLNCCSESMVGVLSLKVTQHKISVETRSKDNVFVTISLAVRIKVAQNQKEFSVHQGQYYRKGNASPPKKNKKLISIDEESQKEEDQEATEHADLVPSIHPDRDDKLLYNAYYRIDNPVKMILCHVEEHFRFHGMEYTLDEMFAAKDDMTHELKDMLNYKMNQFGHIVTDILVLDIDPDEKVKAAMNDIITCEKEKRAQQSRAEADKMTKILSAEADARTRELAGEGIANARKAILNGLQTSVENFQQAIPDSDPGQVLMTVLMTQYMDTVKEAALNGRNTFVLPSSPTQIVSIEEQLRAAISSSTLVR
jgi:regulator of protease activity HflC (stomatin/prohibitin superfamily)